MDWEIVRFRVLRHFYECEKTGRWTDFLDHTAAALLTSLKGIAKAKSSNLLLNLNGRTGEVACSGQVAAPVRRPSACIALTELTGMRRIEFITHLFTKALTTAMEQLYRELYGTFSDDIDITTIMRLDAYKDWMLQHLQGTVYGILRLLIQTR